MPCANRDASLLTQKRRGMALNSYYNSWKAATVNSSSGGVAATTGPARTSAEVIGEIYLGCQTCNAINATTDPNVSRYPSNPSAGGARGLTGSS